MMEMFCIAIFGIELLVAILLQFAKFRLPIRTKSDQIKTISFIIPFHNEADRISPLIQSINASQYKGECELIFVDDYSTDKTEQILKDQVAVPYRVIKNESGRGKKQAIKFGVLAAKNEFIITWDADIKFAPDYIQHLFMLPIADLIILPVRMTSATFAGKLACIEFSFIETFNMGFAGFHKPIVCNGANLGFRRAVFLELDQSRKDYNVPSGDDLFLMHAMIMQQKDIAVYKNDKLLIATDAPSTFIDVLRQRNRWKGKMKTLWNVQTVLPILLQIGVAMASVITVILAVHNPLFLLFFLLKFVAEIIAAWSFVKRNIMHIFVLLLHQIWYPIYATAIIFLPLGKEKRWS